VERIGHQTAVETNGSLFREPDIPYRRAFELRTPVQSSMHTTTMPYQMSSCTWSFILMGIRSLDHNDNMSDSEKRTVCFHIHRMSNSPHIQSLWFSWNMDY
jgi:hypothetical protein